MIELERLREREFILFCLQVDTCLCLLVTVNKGLSQKQIDKMANQNMDQHNSAVDGNLKEKERAKLSKKD